MIGARSDVARRSRRGPVHEHEKELVTGSGFGFEDFSAHELRGVPGTWQVFAVTSVDDQARPPPLVAEEATRRLDDIQPSAEPVSRRRRAALIGGTAALVAVATMALVVATENGSTPRTGGSGPDSESVVNISLDGSVLGIDRRPHPAGRGAGGASRSDIRWPSGKAQSGCSAPSGWLYHIDPDDEKWRRRSPCRAASTSTTSRSGSTGSGSRMPPVSPK